MASNLASELSGTQVVELVMRLGKAGLTVEKVKELMGDDKEMAEFVKNGLTKSPYLAIPAAIAYERYAAKVEGRAFTVLVEYRQRSYAELKLAFDWVNKGYKNAEFKPIDICKDVSTETREIEFELVHLNEDVSTDEILADLDKRGFRPALYEELLAFATKHPDEQKKYEIVALGSVCRSSNGHHLCSPYLSQDDLGRGLIFDWVEGGWWDDDYRFLVVRK